MNSSGDGAVVGAGAAASLLVDVVDVPDVVLVDDGLALPWFDALVEPHPANTNTAMTNNRTRNIFLFILISSFIFFTIIADRVGQKRDRWNFFIKQKFSCCLLVNDCIAI